MASFLSLQLKKIMQVLEIIIKYKMKLYVETPEVGGHVPPQVLGYQLTLFGPREADYARHITSAPHLFGQCGVSEQHYFIHLYLIFRLSKGLDKIYKT